MPAAHRTMAEQAKHHTQPTGRKEGRKRERNVRHFTLPGAVRARNGIPDPRFERRKDEREESAHMHTPTSAFFHHPTAFLAFPSAAAAAEEAGAKGRMSRIEDEETGGCC